MDTLLSIHSLLRWAVLFDAVITIGLCAALWFRLLNLGAGVVQQVSRAYTIMLDIEVALGLLLWLLRLLNGPALPVTTLVAHPVLMLLAAGVAHMTLLRANRVSDERARGQLLTLGFLGSLVLVLVAIPGVVLR